MASDGMYNTQKAPAVLWTPTLARQFDTFRQEISIEQQVERLERFFPLLQLHSFEYMRDEDRQEGKEALLSCWQFLLNNVDEAPYKDRALYFNSIVHLMRRQEWSMEYLAFDREMLPNCAAWECKLAVEYRTLLCATMQYTAEKLSRENVFPSLLLFSARVLAINYFCIPNLFGIIVQAILPDDQLEAWNEKNPKLAADLRVLIKHDKTMAQERHQQGGMSLPQNLIQYLYLFKGLPPWNGTVENGFEASIDDPWVKRLAARGNLFLMFCKEFANHVRMVFRRSMKTAVVPWCTIPGYSSLLTALLLTMGTTPPTQHSEQLVDCTKCMLANPYTLTLFTHVLFNVTNVHDNAAVVTALDRMSMWLKVFARQHSKRTVANTFNPELLFNVVAMLLESDHCTVLCKTMQFVYYNMGAFQGEHRMHLVATIMLKRNFFHLFLHWHEGVRRFYIRILVYKMVRLVYSQRWRRWGPKPGDTDSAGPIWDEWGESDVSIADAEGAIDQVISSKVDSYMKLLHDQVGRSTVIRPPKTSRRRRKSFPNLFPPESASGGAPSAAAPSTPAAAEEEEQPRFFPRDQEVYASRAIAEYKICIAEYETWLAEALKHVNEPPRYPEMPFVLKNTFKGE